MHRAGGLEHAGERLARQEDQRVGLHHRLVFAHAQGPHRAGHGARVVQRQEPGQRLARSHHTHLEHGDAGVHTRAQRTLGRRHLVALRLQQSTHFRLARRHHQGNKHLVTSKSFNGIY